MPKSHLHGLEGTPLGSFGEKNQPPPQEKSLPSWLDDDNKEPNTNIPANDIWRGSKKRKKGPPPPRRLYS